MIFPFHSKPGKQERLNKTFGARPPIKWKGWCYPSQWTQSTRSKTSEQPGLCAQLWIVGRTNFQTSSSDSNTNEKSAWSTNDWVVNVCLNTKTTAFCTRMFHRSSQCISCQNSWSLRHTCASIRCLSDISGNFDNRVETKKQMKLVLKQARKLAQ